MSATSLTGAHRLRTPRWALVSAGIILGGAVLDVAITAALWHATATFGGSVAGAEANPIQRGLLALGGEPLALAARLVTAIAGASLIVYGARHQWRVRVAAVVLAAASLLLVSFEIAHVPTIQRVLHENAVASRIIAVECRFAQRTANIIRSEGRQVPTSFRLACGSEAQQLGSIAHP